ncbi:hypothetical protein IEQ44_07920 [Nocardioides sp. Y6]|uniref:Transposase n=1 Tax=Nocardioides malaquae TaxID=2773426 RepID=A0ABR9RSP3_9ACTN|nr:hypothetical protein [Nocardioides malaquae]MBE7324576.1 hypothetical protein [Nocardioides malaquae]
MTQSALTAAAVAYVSSLTPKQVNDALTDEDITTVAPVQFRPRMSRAGEDTSSVGPTVQMRAIYTSQWFWEIAAECPNNRIWWGGKETDLDKRREGAPLHFPDYLMLFLVCLAGVKGVGTINAAATLLRDEKVWRDLVEHMDTYVPEEWTKLGDLPQRNPKRTPKHATLATPGTEPTDRTRPLQPTKKKAKRKRKGNVTQLRPRNERPLTAPPSPNTLDYWVLKWRGYRRSSAGRVRLEPGHEYYGLQARVMAKFRETALAQAQAMGVLDSTANFVYNQPDRNQYVGFDGVVFKAPRKGRLSTVGTYMTGTGEAARGTKYGITSTRVNGQRHSRVILDFAHIHKSLDGSYRGESPMVEATLPGMREATNGGIKGLLVDSVIRGRAVEHLQRHGVTVINYPHAKTNPKGGAGRRLAEGRVEKTHLRHAVSHLNDFHINCEHHVFAVGGELMEAVFTGEGTYALTPLPVVKYEQRGKATNGTRREYLTVKITCPHTRNDLTERIALFHTPATSNDPNYIWGEVCRVYPPGSWQAKYLYGARNDTEARHADLKARVQHLPGDRDGQMLRLLGASIANNAFSWQVHLQAHGLDNVVDDTA